MFSGRRSWCSISHSVQRLQALRDLADNVAQGLQFGLRIVDHPLREALPLDVVHCHVEGAAPRRRRCCPHDMRAAHAPGDPFLHHQGRFQIGRVVAHFDRRNLDRDELPPGLLRQIDVAAMFRAALAQDAETVEPRARLRQGGGWRVGIEQFQDLALGDSLNPQYLSGQIVRTAARQRRVDQCFRGGIEIGLCLAIAASMARGST